jgi:hypothetical protein
LAARVERRRLGIAAHAEIKPQAGRRPKTEVSPVSDSEPRRQSVSRRHRS